MPPKTRFLVLGALLLGGCSMGSVQETVNDSYMNDQKLIHAYPNEITSEYLSESIGLYMEYLVLIDDNQSFQEQYEILTHQFIDRQAENTFIQWRLDTNSTTNALIDDLRIISSLEKAAEQFDNKAYLKFAEELSKSITNLQNNNGFTVDFYDWKHHLPAKRVTLSYLEDTDLLLEKTVKLLVEVSDAEVFFPEYYDVSEQIYMKSEEIHMIDQLLIAINLGKEGIKSEVFQEWIVAAWIEEGRVYGRYDREFQDATVEYESLAVYYYLHEYFLLIGEEVLAKEVKMHVNTLVESDILKNAHFFDYIHYQLLLMEKTS